MANVTVASLARVGRFMLLAMMEFGIIGAANAATNELRPWQEYHTIMWIGDSAYKKPGKIPLFFQRLREMGINTGMVYGDGDPQSLLANMPQYYVENMLNRGLCLKFNSEVADWDQFVNNWAKNGRPNSAFQRPFCLDDPAWRSWGRKTMEQLAGKNAPHNPLCSNIRDELSTTFSANPFDYDFNPVALAKFREWLQGRYRDVAGLNAEWKTRFADWNDVRPFSTDEIKNRMASGEALPRGKPDWQALAGIKLDFETAKRTLTRWNFAPWCDFRTYMDISLAEALADFRTAAHRVDPQTPVGIEGTQMPSAFGGYDLWRLSQALDWVEPYDIGNSREIFASFMPGKPVITTVFENDTNHARRRLWHLLLEGDRGSIVWWSEDCIDWRSDDYALTPKAKSLAPALQEMTSPLAQLFLRAEREYDPVFIYYSQPSIQVDWLLESTVDGSTWPRRFSSFESEHNEMAKTRNAWVRLFQDLGYSPQFVSSAQIENGALRNMTNAALVLPTTLALGDNEAREMDNFLSHQPATAVRVLFCDGIPGVFDEHGKLRLAGGLARVFPAAEQGPVAYAVRDKNILPECKTGRISDYALQRLTANASAEWPGWAARNLPRKAEVQVRAMNSEPARVRIHRFRSGDTRLVAFERNIDYQMSEELKQAGGNEVLERPVKMEATISRPAHIYDLRAARYLGYADHFEFDLDPWQPTLIAVSPVKLREEGLVDALMKPGK